MNEKAILAMFKHLTGNPNATINDVEHLLEELGFSPEEVINASPFDMIRLAKLQKDIEEIKEFIGNFSIGPYTFSSDPVTIPVTDPVVWTTTTKDVDEVIRFDYPAEYTLSPYSGNSSVTNGGK